MGRGEKKKKRQIKERMSDGRQINNVEKKKKKKKRKYNRQGHETKKSQREYFRLRLEEFSAAPKLSHVQIAKDEGSTEKQHGQCLLDFQRKAQLLFMAFLCIFFHFLFFTYCYFFFLLSFPFF